MKNLLTLFVFLIGSQLAIGQGIIEKNYQHHLDNQEVTHVYLSGKLFDFATVIASGIEDEELKELSEFASTIQSFSLIKVPNNGTAEADYKKGMSNVRNSYDELLRVRDDGEKFSVYVDEEDDIVYEIVGLGVVENEFIALSLVGEMDLNKIAEFISKAEGDVLEPLKRITNHKANQMKVYPNPTTSNSEMNVELPENMIGGKGTVYDSNGATVLTFSADVKKTTIGTENLSPGKYIVDINKDGISIKKHIIVIQ